MKFCSNRTGVVSLGDHFDAEQLQTYLQENYRAVRYRDAFQVTLDGGEAWVFSYGCVVFWGVGEDDRQSLLTRLQALAGPSATQSHEEDFVFAIGGEQHSIRHDTIALADDEPLNRLAVSHALAQSLQLNVFEARAQQTIVDTGEIPMALSKSGRIPHTRKAIAKMRGQLFATKSDIILHYGLLDTPEFFWEYPEYEPLYSLAARYLDIRPRVELLSHKLETIHELLEMLADEQKHRHSSFLEWIIIVLIAIEIVIFLAEEMGLR